MRLKRINTGIRSIHRERGVGVERTAFSKRHGKVVYRHASTVPSVLYFVLSSATRNWSGPRDVPSTQGVTTAPMAIFLMQAAMVVI